MCRFPAEGALLAERVVAPYHQRGANAQLYSANLAAEAKKGLHGKAKKGGTPGLAPIGYLNVRKVIDGCEVRTIEIDHERAPHVQWAFAAYASGAYTLDTLHAALERRGLTTRPTRKRPARPLSRAQLANLLASKYYLGTVTYGGVVGSRSSRARDAVKRRQATPRSPPHCNDAASDDCCESEPVRIRPQSWFAGYGGFSSTGWARSSASPKRRALCNSALSLEIGLVVCVGSAIELVTPTQVRGATSSLPAALGPKAIKPFSSF